MNDVRVLRNAIELAKKEGLLQEFRDGYRNYRNMSDCVHAACWCAMYDWDMLPLEPRDDGLCIGVGAA